MNLRIYAVPVLLPGLIIAQAIAAIQVYFSNTELYRTLEIIKDHGYLPVPNELVMPYLKQILPAFWGGLFFTLSLGAGLSLASFAAAWAWDRFLIRNKIFLVLYILCWLGFLIGVNFRGLNFRASTYFLFVPPVVFLTALRWIPPQGRQQRPRLRRLIPVAAIFLLALLWISQTDRHFFLDMRDHLLLSHPLGRKINDFYYNYTLYTAEVFKSLDQKMLKTCNLNGVRREPVARAFERELLNHDYLTVGDAGAVDLKVVEAEGNFILQHGKTPMVRTTLKEFLSKTGQVLNKFSMKTDRHAYFRQVTFICLLLGLPILLCIFLYDLLRLVFCFFVRPKRSSLIASALCFILGISLLAVFGLIRGKVIEVKCLAETLKSENRLDRIAALKIVEQKGLEISDFAAYRRLLSSQHISERYWLVRTLGVSRKAHTYKDLVGFLDDPHPNVVSMAFYALGRRGAKRTVPEILKRIKTDNHWHTQWYAYKALKSLGWKQNRYK